MKIINHKVKIRTFILTIIVFIMSLIVSVYMLLNGDTILKKFNIISLDNSFKEFTCIFDKVKAADHYKITIYDKNNEKIYDENTKKTKYNFTLDNLNYNEEYLLTVSAIDKEGNIKKSNNDITFTWTEPTIEKNNSILLNDEDYLISLNGEIDKKEYTYQVKNKNKVLLTKKIDDSIIELSKDLYINKEMIIKVSILYKDKELDSIYLYNRVNPISDIEIEKPTNATTFDYEDINLKYTGGTNADTFKLNIYTKDNQLIKSSIITKKNIVISKKVFERNKEYILEIEGSYEDYIKSSSINIKVSKNESCMPVYLSKDTIVKENTKIELRSLTKGAKIYYTLNGDDPETLGTLYKEPITIKKDTILKTVAIKDGMSNSIVKTYDIKVDNKKDIVVFLSPSNQFNNINELSNFTNESDEMNEIANYVEERLKDNNIKVIRNNPKTNSDLWIKDSRYYKADCYISIHANSSSSHESEGIETWIDNESSTSLSLASIIETNLIKLYGKGTKLVKFADGSLDEINDELVNKGILVEVGYYDNIKDANWINENKKVIGYNIADSIINYYK